jgi:hypothetical protein
MSRGWRRHVEDRRALEDVARVEVQAAPRRSAGQVRYLFKGQAAPQMGNHNFALIQGQVESGSVAAAALHVWLWSPDAAAMDLRHYDTRAHDLDSSYEDVQPGFSTPRSFRRTSRPISPSRSEGWLRSQPQFIPASESEPAFAI